MGKSYSISSADLEKYVDSEPRKVSRFADWMQLQSQIHVEGLSNLHKKLKKPGVTLSKIREDCSAGLLRDLEKASKMPCVKGWRRPEFKSKFKPEFYKELKKPAEKRSREYNEFIADCAENFTANRHAVEKASVEALKALDKPKIKSKRLKEVVRNSISRYKKDYTEQAKKDWVRSAILYKGNDGKTRHLSFDELKEGKELGLTGQQRDFLVSCWQQGSFSSGWFSSIQMNIFSDKEANRRKILPGKGGKITEVLIDASGKEVKVYNRLEQYLIEEIDGDPRMFPVAEAVLSVDITSLKGDEFVPGCASKKPKIQFDIQRLDESVRLKLPKDLERSKPKKTSGGRMKISEYIKKESAKGYFEMMRSEGEWEQAKGKESLEKLLGVNEVLSSLRGGRSVLDEKAIKAIKTMVVKVAEVTEDFDEGKRKTLENNLAKIIRRSAREEGKAMSWGQFAQSLGDRIMDSISATFSWSQKSKTQQIIEKYGDFVKEVKKHLPAKEAKYPRFHGSKKKPERSRG